MHLFLRFTIAMMIGSFLVPLSANAEELAPKFVRVPVFFATDRNLQSESPKEGVSFGPHRKYTGECLHQPFFGMGYCVLPNTAQKEITPQLKSLGWEAADKKEKEGDRKVTIIDGSDFDSKEKNFYAAVSESALKSHHKDIVLFAHGYKNAFTTAWHTAARFSYAYETPVVLYSWPSVAKLRSYDSDESNNEWSQEHFDDTLAKFEQLCTSTPPVKLRVFAHSMGTRLVVRAGAVLREQPCVAEVCLVCPDMDDGIVKHYARRALSVDGTTAIRVYMSQHDKALVLSQLLHGGYTRLGECAESISGLADNIIGVRSKSPAPESIQTHDSKVAETRKRLQTIDFTTLDSGLLGHTIPVDLIYSMSYSNQPSKGLKFVEEQSGERSGTSRFITKLTKLQKPVFNQSTHCLRVVRTDATD